MYVILNKIFQNIKNLIDATGMYRTVTLTLSFLVLCSVLFGFSGLMLYSGEEQLVSLAIAVSVALLTNITLGKLFKAHVNNESAFITALIIFFLVLPAPIDALNESWLIALIVFVAISSKFFLVWKKQHLFNPAAFGVAIVALFFYFFPDAGYFESAWWIGQPIMFVPLVVAGLLVLTKLRRFIPVLIFIATAFVFYIFESWRIGTDVLSQIPSFWLSGPVLFLAFFMLTEPFTFPPTKNLQISYAVLIGFLSQTTIFASLFKMTPELALVIGNLVFFAFTLRQKLFLSLVEKREVAKNTFEFIFTKPKNLTFSAGQYLEWMLPHDEFDNRGIRRYFTIASAPSDQYLRIGVRFGDKISSFKTKLKSMEVGDKIIASQLAGDFVLPKDTNKKVAMVAGGIGITPFVSQVGEMLKGDIKHDSVLLNCNNTAVEVAYKDILAEAEAKLPFRLINILAKEKVAGCEYGFLTEEIIKRQVPDYLERFWYISGPPMMVGSYKKLLESIGVSGSQIVTDFFPGLA